MRLSHLATAATVALSTQAEQSEALTAAFQFPHALIPNRERAGSSQSRHLPSHPRSLRHDSAQRASVFGAGDFRLGANLPPEAQASIKTLIHEMTLNESVRPMLDTITHNSETGQALGLLLGAACFFVCLERAKHKQTAGETESAPAVGDDLPQKIRNAHESLVLMSRNRLSKDKLKNDLDEILQLLNRRLGGGGDDDPEPEKPKTELCSLPVYWKRLGLAYERTIYGAKHSPRIVVDTSLHPDLSRPGCPFETVKYVITHSDSSGQLCVSVVPKGHELDDGNWYQALMRDEVLAEFVRHPETCKPYLVFRTYVGKGDHGKGSSAEVYLESMRGWSSAPGWQDFVTRLTKSWLRARLQVFDAHRFHPVEGLLEVLDPSFELNKEWEQAKVVWVNQSGDPDFNTMHDVGSVKTLLDELRNTSEQEKQKKHVDNRKKAWRDMAGGAKSSLENLFRNLSMYWTRPENAQLRQEVEHTLLFLSLIFNDLLDGEP